LTRRDCTHDRPESRSRLKSGLKAIIRRANSALAPFRRDPLCFRHRLDRDTIVFSRRGLTVQQVSIVPDSKPKAVRGNGFLRLE
jgi:hypothetical protein